jgi:uncharacterized delta-60 repeat protein
MVRYNTDGSIDNSFGTNGDGKVLTDVNTSASDEILAQAILENDKIVVTGVTSSTAVLARYTNDGVLDTSFGSNGLSLYMFGTTCTSRDLLIQPDNKIVIVGESFLPNNKYLIARYTEDGILDTTFNTTGYNLGNFSTNNNKFNSVLMQSDGKLLATGLNQIGNGVYTTIARFHSGLNLNVNEFNNESFVVYPNPSSGIVSINTTGGTVKRVRVLNGLGQEVLPMMDLVEDNTVVDLSGLMVGVYWMALELGDGRQVVKKLVKR